MRNLIIAGASEKDRSEWRLRPIAVPPLKGFIVVMRKKWSGGEWLEVHNEIFTSDDDARKWLKEKAPRSVGLAYIIEIGTKKMTTDEIQAAVDMAKRAKELAEKATPGPWDESDDDGNETCGVCSEEGYHSTGPWDVSEDEAIADTVFIAASRTTVPALADAVIALDEELTKVQEENERLRRIATTAFLVLRGMDEGAGGTDLLIGMRNELRDALYAPHQSKKGETR